MTEKEKDQIREFCNEPDGEVEILKVGSFTVPSNYTKQQREEALAEYIEDHEEELREFFNTEFGYLTEVYREAVNNNKDD